MAVRIIQKWLDGWYRRRHKKDTETKFEIKNVVTDNGFSPATYRNPFVFYMYDIITQVIKQKQISYRNLELIIIDAEEDYYEDRDDIRIVLNDLSYQLNYLMVLTDRPEMYESFCDRMYEENGLIVQTAQKSARRGKRGNFVIDFERSGGISAENMIYSNAIYLPIYKKPWEIGENLDIIVPVGYNTLIVNGIFLSQPEEGSPKECDSFNSIDRRLLINNISKIDRLDQEFRKG